MRDRVFEALVSLANFRAVRPCSADYAAMEAAGSSGRPRVLPALAASLAIVVLWLVVVWVSTTVAQAVRPPPCFGIGFGCSLDASAATLLTGVVVGVPALLAAWVVTVIGWAASARASSAKTRRWLVWGAPAVLTMAAVVQAIGSTVGELLG